MEKREHTYTLRFDNGPDQRVKASGPTEAVAARAGAAAYRDGTGPEPRLPYQITDETAVKEWIAQRLAAREARLLAEAEIGTDGWDTRRKFPPKVFG